jgi:hypothetical protein
MLRQQGFLGCGPRRVLNPPKAKQLILPGTTTGYVSTPDSTAADITGDLDIRLWMMATDWTPASIQYLLTKFETAGQISYLLSLTAAGALQLEWSTDGAAVTTATSTVATSIADGAFKWVRCAVDVDDGGVYKVYFYLSDDGVTWTQLGSTVTGGATTSFFSSTSNVTISGYGNGANNPLNGAVKYAEILNGIDGTRALVFDVKDAKPGDRIVRSSRTGELWTLNGGTVLL